MIVAGCDVGSLTAKAVVMKDGIIIGNEIIKSKRDPEQSALSVMDAAAKKAAVSMEDIEYCGGTGYGQRHIPFVNHTESEIACHAKGAVWQAPSARTVVDIGGQDAKAIRIDEKGNVLRYAYNDKCASGTGRFLEIIADALEIALDDMGSISSQSKNKLTLSNQCVIFAETEIISLVNDGREIPDIVKALHNSVANRAASLAKSIEVEPGVVMTGGVARNIGMFMALGRALNTEILRIEHPQLNGAIGAALIAAERARGPDDYGA